MTSEQQRRRVSNVFISHSMDDRELAINLAGLLSQGGITGYVAVEVRQWNTTIAERIKTELANSHCLVVILSQKGRQSASVNQEIGFAVSRGIPVILMIEEGVQKGQIGVFAYGRDSVPFTREKFAEACATIRGDLSQMTVDKITSQEAREREERRIAEARVREDRAKSEVLQRIRFNTNTILTILERTQQHIELHRRDPINRPWQEVRDAIIRPDIPSVSLIAETERLGRQIEADFRLLAFRIDNTNLIGANFWNRFVHLSIVELQRVVGLNNPTAIQIQNMQEALEVQIHNLNEALDLIDREMPREEEN